MKNPSKIIESDKSVLHRLGWEISNFSEPESVVLKTAHYRREFYILRLCDGNETRAVIAIPLGFGVPDYEQLYSHYLDFNVDIFLLFRRIEESFPETLFLVYTDSHRAYLYDAESRECLVHGERTQNGIEDVYPYLDKNNLTGGGAEDPGRKSSRRLARELLGWMDLWSAEMGSGTGASRTVMNRFMKKISLARYYRILFGPETPHLLFDGFVSHPSRPGSGGMLASPVNFLKDLFSFFSRSYHLDVFETRRSEISFLKKAGGARGLLSAFLHEFNLLSRDKFSLDVFQTIWCPDKERMLSTKKAYTTRKDGFKKELFADDSIVLKPAVGDLEKHGAPWALDLLEKTVLYWMDYNRIMEEKKTKAEQSGNERMNPPLRQMDAFASSSRYMTPEGVVTDMVNHSLETSFRIIGLKSSSDKERVIFLVVAKIFEIWKKYNLPRTPLNTIPRIFEPPIM